MTHWAVLACALSASPMLFAQPAQRAATKARPPKVSTTATCAAELGAGASSGRRFCDVIVATKPAESIAITIPPRRGTARLLFDLHNRVAVPPDTRQSAQTFTRNSAIVSVLGPKGEIGRGAAVSEFRTVADLFDRISGGPAGGVKAVGPGSATPVDVTIPAGITTIGIVGVRLEVVTRLGKQMYDTPGRPIAIVSNLRVEYTPTGR